jgi:peptidoglycan-associated lipoprotein
MKTNFVTLFAAVSLAAGCASTEEQAQPAPEPQASTLPRSPQPAARPTERQGVPGSAAAPDARAPSARGTMAAPGQASVFFDYDSYDIKPEFRSVIEQNAKYVRENAGLQAKIEGNADERGSREYNIALGQRRAEAVMKMMVLLGVPERRMEAVSYGEEKPRGTGHDEASWADNRRSDLMVQPAR